MSPAAKQFEKLHLGRRLLHGGNPVLSWMVSNVTIKMNPAGNIKPDKAKSRDRIDGIVALVMAAGREMVHEEPHVPAGRCDHLRVLFPQFLNESQSIEWT